MVFAMLPRCRFATDQTDPYRSLRKIYLADHYDFVIIAQYLQG
jgi:hypothetical protein